MSAQASTLRPGDVTDRVADLVARAIRAGASSADALYANGTSVGVSVRHGKTEELERAETTDLGLRVFAGKRAAIVSATTLDPSRFDALVEQALAMAQVLPEDQYAGLAEEAFSGEIFENTLDLLDTAEPDTATLLHRAKTAEDAALSVAGVTNSSGGLASYGRSEITIVASNGFSGRYGRTRHSTSVSVLAGSGIGMQRDYDHHGTVHLADLDDAATLGLSAANKAVARLNPGKPRTGEMPVLFAPRVAGSLLGHLSGAINGVSIARGTSFLKESMGKRIFPAGVTVTDDPLRLRGARSRPFDGEGVRSGALTLVEDGILREWVLDSRSARQLGLVTNGRGSRGTSSPPSPGLTNLFFGPGTVSPAALMADIQEGIYITEMMGSAINGITGDYSRGASGFMIRNGQIAEPCAEFTVAGNLVDMFARIILADDLTFRFGTDAPTIRIDAMSIAGA